jgi:hypothetical protein
MRSSWAKSLLPAVLTSAVALLAPSAAARVDASSGYSKAQTYSGALRYLRVDLGYEVLEKDPDAAYLIFKYAPQGQSKNSSTGTLEVVEVEGRVRLFVSLPRMPEYHERMFRDGLLRKLRDEYGAPVAAKKPKQNESEPEKPPHKPDENDRDSGKPSP